MQIGHGQMNLALEKGRHADLFSLYEKICLIVTHNVEILLSYWPTFIFNIKIISS